VCDPDDGGLTLPDGFCATVVADSLGQPRHLAVADNGDVYAAVQEVTNGGGLVALRDEDGDYKADRTEYFGDTGGTGVALRDGYLYFGPPASVQRYEKGDDELVPSGEAETVVDLPDQDSHAAKPIDFDGEGNLYVNVGAPSNACMEESRTKGSPGQDPCPLLDETGGIWQYDADRIRAYTDEHVQSSRDLHPMDFVASVMSDLGAETGRVGVEMDAHYYTARSDRRLRDGLPGASFADATLLVNRVRLRKSEREIRYMEQAGRLADEGMRRGMEAVAQGVRESDVAAEIYRGLVSGTEEHGGDYPAIVPLLPAGERSTTPHLTWSDRRYREGDPVIVELAGVRHRYHAPLARTAFVGEPPAEVARTADAVVEGLEAALAAVRPGAAAEDVERAWRESIAAHGLEKSSRLGYSCGLGYPPDWGEGTVSLRPGDETVLEPGMTFHVIPGLWLETFGVEISETVVVTGTGGRTLSGLPRELWLR
jgi:Xaa-Pro aminopeptidase